jgi:hypothetical protein
VEVTVGYGRQISPQQYEKQEASRFFKLTDVDTQHLTAEQVYDTALQLHNTAVIEVCEALGLAYEADADGRVREVMPPAGQVVQAFPGAVAQPQAAVAAPPAPAPAAPPAPPQQPPPPAPPAAAPVPQAQYPMPPNLPYTGQQDKDVLIADINANPHLWEDVRAKKRNPEGAGLPAPHHARPEEPAIQALCVALMGTSIYAPANVAIVLDNAADLIGCSKWVSRTPG